MSTASKTPPPFGTAFAEMMTSAVFDGGTWSAPVLQPVSELSLHPAAHVLHYASACFEGLKAHRSLDGRVRVFRMDRNVERMQRSAQLMHLPVPQAAMLTKMIGDVVAANLERVPETPGSLYIRPTLIGTDINIGAAASPSQSALLYVICSPVGDYFAGGIRPLRVAVEVERPRSTPQFGMVKAGANYAMALPVIMREREETGVDQVLFASGGVVQETGATNVLLVDTQRIVTPALNESFLHGITRDSLLRLGLDLGYEIEEVDLSVDLLLDWCARSDAEAALSGTAAVLAPVGTLVHKGEDIAVGSGKPGPNTLRLRTALTEIQSGKAPDPYGWMTEIA